MFIKFHLVLEPGATRVVNGRSGTKFLMEGCEFSQKETFVKLGSRSRTRKFFA